MNSHDIAAPNFASTTDLRSACIRLTNGAPLHSLYLGSPGGAGFTATALEEVEGILSATFSSYTLVPATGVYRGKPMPSLVVHIATTDTSSVHATSLALGKALRQEAIGLQLMGQFYTIEME